MRASVVAELGVAILQLLLRLSTAFLNLSSSFLMASIRSSDPLAMSSHRLSHTFSSAGVLANPLLAVRRRHRGDAAHHLGHPCQSAAWSLMSLASSTSGRPAPAAALDGVVHVDIRLGTDAEAVLVARLHLPHDRHQFVVFLDDGLGLLLEGVRVAAGDRVRQPQHVRCGLLGVLHLLCVVVARRRTTPRNSARGQHGGKGNHQTCLLMRTPYNRHEHPSNQPNRRRGIGANPRWLSGRVPPNLIIIDWRRFQASDPICRTLSTSPRQPRAIYFFCLTFPKPCLQSHPSIRPLLCSGPAVHLLAGRSAGFFVRIPWIVPHGRITASTTAVTPPTTVRPIALIARSPGPRSPRRSRRSRCISPPAARRNGSRRSPPRPTPARPAGRQGPSPCRRASWPRRSRRRDHLQLQVHAPFGRGAAAGLSEGHTPASPSAAPPGLLTGWAGVLAFAQASGGA